MWDAQTTPHNPMLDHLGRVWFTTRIRTANTPAFCKRGSDHPSAKLYPIDRAGRQVSVYDPRTQTLKYVDTCFTTHHLAFAEDANNTLWLSAGGAGAGYVGWINTKLDRRRAECAQCKCRIPQQSRGVKRACGTRPCRAEPAGGPDQGQAHRRGPLRHRLQRQRRQHLGLGAQLPRRCRAHRPGDDLPATTLAERVPWNEPRAAINGFGPRGMDIGRDGVWVPPLAWATGELRSPQVQGAAH